MNIKSDINEAISKTYILLTKLIRAVCRTFLSLVYIVSVHHHQHILLTMCYIYKSNSCTYATLPAKLPDNKAKLVRIYICLCNTPMMSI